MDLPPWLWGIVVSVALLVVNIAQFFFGRRERRELKAAKGSKLLCEVLRASIDVGRRPVTVQQGPGGKLVEQSWVHITYRAQLSITNRSDRPNSIRSIRLDVRGARPFGLPGLICLPERKLMEGPHPDYGEPLLTPINIPAGVSTVQRYVAFEAEFVDPRFDEDATDVALLIVDGHDRLYEIGGLEEP